MADKPRILLLDIETAPNVVYVWGLYDQTISHEHMVETSYIMCWSAKWYEADKLIFRASFDKNNTTKYRASLMEMHRLLDEADVVVHYYGSKFDIPTLNREFAKFHITPPSPYRQVDLKLIVAKAFRFESNKLDYVAEQLGFGKKIDTEFTLWVDCMHGNKAQQKYMENYNRHDVVLLEKVYTRLIPWIDKHPNYSAYQRGICCPKCGSEKLQSRGNQVTQTSTFTRFHCQQCGGWSRDNKRIDTKSLRAVNIVA